ncbi:basic phospholipase A2 VRV-PL-VIIIa-like [Paroedura picta]|uniref:basic phospholipase A2 VRV-PL-VIIIa-like n=1 Tax=Paroedura picta TaxID=143630 RepID=UPI0040571594
MKVLWGVIVLLACNMHLAQGSLLEFGQMIKIATGESAFPTYTTYGCYCGLGGKGQPQDATDRCCLAHDCCYRALKEECKPKTDRYKFTSHNGNLTCEEGSWCEMETCKCDRVAALCFRDNLNSYNETLRFHFRFLCDEGPKLC